MSTGTGQDHSATTTRLGYSDAAHTAIDGTQFSSTTSITESGYAIGYSNRYNGTTDAGRSHWLFDAGAGTTARLGYFDSAHTRSDGFQLSSVTRVTESGYAAGDSKRYNGATDAGRSAWLFDAGTATTTRVGSFDSTHTRSDGFQSSAVLGSTESGFFAGQSNRYAGGTALLGHSSWIYRASDQSQHIILFSERSDGYAESSIFFLGEDGLALGSYELYAEDDTWLGGRAFAWTPDDGAFELGPLVMGLDAAGWSHLASAIRANGLAQIVGSGRLQSGGDLAYLLLAIPEPGAGLFLSIGLLGLAVRRSA